MDKKFAIFDMDGTLVDSMGYWNRLADEYLARFGLPGLSPALKEESIALTMLESAQLFIREFGLPGTPEQIAGEINALMEEHYRADVPLKPGAAELLARLKAAGVKMCVASSTHPALIDLCLRRLEGWARGKTSPPSTWRPPGGWGARQRIPSSLRTSWWPPRLPNRPASPWGSSTTSTPTRSRSSSRSWPTAGLPAGTTRRFSHGWAYKGPPALRLAGARRRAQPVHWNKLCTRCKRDCPKALEWCKMSLDRALSPE